MQLRVQSADVLVAASHLLLRSDATRGQLAGCAQIPHGLRDPVLRAGVTELGDVSADVLELVAADLVLLSTKVRASALQYDRVEGAVTAVMSP